MVALKHTREYQAWSAQDTPMPASFSKYNDGDLQISEMLSQHEQHKPSTHYVALLVAYHLLDIVA